MDKKQWSKVEDVIDDVLTLPKEEREVYVLKACSGNVALLEEVNKLLHSIEDAEVTGFLKHSLQENKEFINNLFLKEDERSAAEYIGRKIHHFLIRKQIGSGGMGVVFLAERADGQFEQQVALKLIKRGMDSESILFRFSQERQLLASLNHPHIAKIIDGGMTEDGLSWFAMEYIDGVPITDYCRQYQIGLKERLQLFEKVCRAVQHAHQRLIIHRDLKPTNILVTGDGTPHLLDFGLAKVLRSPLGDDETIWKGQWMLTLDYASPEQFKEEAVGTPSDTYQLGLILYELLTERKPYTVKGLSPSEAEHIICNIDPPRPSTHGKNGQIAWSQKHLRGDLDTIVMKALHKDPEKGYMTAETLANDIHRYLNELPILARPDSYGYRINKFVRRNRWVVIFITSLFFLLFGYAFTLTIQNDKIKTERKRAQQEALKSEQLVEYLTSIFRSNDPYKSKGDNLSVGEVLEGGIDNIDRLQKQPELQVALLGVTGDIYYHLSQYEQARQVYNRATIIWDSLRNIDKNLSENEDLIRGLARIHGVSDEQEMAASLYLNLINRANIANLRTPEYQSDLFEYYIALHKLNKKRVADSIFDIWESQIHQLPVEIDEWSANRWIDMAHVLMIKGGMNDDLDVIKRGQNLANMAIEFFYNKHGLLSPFVAKSLYTRTGLLFEEYDIVMHSLDPLTSQYRLRELDSLSALTLRIHRELFSEQNDRLLFPILQRASVLRLRKKFEDAENILLEALQIAQNESGGNSLSYISTKERLAMLYLSKEDYHKAILLFLELSEWWSENYALDYFVTQRIRLSLASAYYQMRDYRNSESVLLPTYQALLKERGVEDSNTQSALIQLVKVYEAWGYPDKANSYREMLAD